MFFTNTHTRITTRIAMFILSNFPRQFNRHPYTTSELQLKLRTPFMCPAPVRTCKKKTSRELSRNTPRPASFKYHIAPSGSAANREKPHALAVHRIKAKSPRNFFLPPSLYIFLSAHIYGYKRARRPFFPFHRYTALYICSPVRHIREGKFCTRAGGHFIKLLPFSSRRKMEATTRRRRMKSPGRGRRMCKVKIVDTGSPRQCVGSFSSASSLLFLFWACVLSFEGDVFEGNVETGLEYLGEFRSICEILRGE